MSISACGTVILRIHTPYVVSKGISGDRGGVFGENSFLCEKVSISACGTVILRIHTPYVVSKGISGDRGGVFGENSFLGKVSISGCGTVILHIHTPYVVSISISATEGEYSAKTVSYVKSVNFSLRDRHFADSHTICSVQRHLRRPRGGISAKIRT